MTPVFQDVEMTGSFLVSSMERISLVSFGETMGYSQIGLLIEKPKAETRDDSLLAPFSSQVRWREVIRILYLILTMFYSMFIYLYGGGR